jgi:hypothetical protein
MSYTTHSEEVINAIKLLDINAKILPEDICTTILERVIKRFTNLKKYEYPIWENMISQKSVRGEHVWQLLAKVLNQKEIVFFFDNVDDKNMFLFPNGNVISDVIAESFGFIFYITNIENEFLLAYNDHDYLIGAGEAIAWIDDIQSGKYNS